MLFSWLRTGLLAAALYHGKIDGLFAPLQTTQDATGVTVQGETWTLHVAAQTGQIDSLRVLDSELLAPGGRLPNPYVGVLPDDDAGATAVGDANRPRFAFEKAASMRPALDSGELTGAQRSDAAQSAHVRLQVLRQDADGVQVRSQGDYPGTALRWEIVYDVAMDGFVRVEVGLLADAPALVRWHCFHHARLRQLPYLTQLTEADGVPPHVLPQGGQDIRGVAPGHAVLRSRFKPFFAFSDGRVGVEFSKQDFGEARTGYHDAAVVDGDGRWVPSGSVPTVDGRLLPDADARGRAYALTQAVVRVDAVEVEDFDLRNTTVPLQRGESRRQVFWLQPTPPKRARPALQGARLVWAGPNQPVLAGWRGQRTPWSPPDAKVLQLWAQMGATHVVGGANFWSGDYSHPQVAAATQQFLQTAHAYGLKVLPYVSLSDFSMAAPGYAEHAAAWMHSDSIEFAAETSLMCYQAAGWRDHVVSQWDTLLGALPFDGLYIDHWDTRLCHNMRHGCGGYVGTYATDGYRDFLRRARQVVAAHSDGQGMILLNANLLQFAGATGFCDMRLNGENDAPQAASESTWQTTYNAAGQGLLNAGIWPAGADAALAAQTIVSAGAALPLMPAQHPASLQAYRADPRPELAVLRDVWDAQRFFAVGQAQVTYGIDHTTYVRDGRVLVVGRFEPSNLLPQTAYRVIDLRRGKVLLRRGDAQAVYGVRLAKDLQVVLVEPVPATPGVAYFRGVNGVHVVQRDGAWDVQLDAPAQGEVELFLDAQTPALSWDSASVHTQRRGDFVVVSGAVPADGHLRGREINAPAPRP